MSEDMRRKLAAAEKRLGELMDGCDELQETSARRFRQLVEMIANGEALESELIEAQCDAQNRENLQRAGAINYEENVVMPLRERVRKLDMEEARSDALKLEKDAARARNELDDFLARFEREEQALRQRLSELENASAKAQRKARTMQ